MVAAAVRVGSTLYIGGGFNAVGPCTGGGVPVDAVSGAPLPSFARVAGQVSAVVPDGAGGWYIGGGFNAVDGVPRANLAHILRDGRLSPWAPAIAGTSAYVFDPRGRPYQGPGIFALALSGQTLYLGGRFSTVAGQPRNNVAAVHARTGAVLPWDPNADSDVRCIGVGGHERTPTPATARLSRDVLFVGGDFTTIGGQPRRGIAALDDERGRATAWDPAPGVVFAMQPRVRTVAVEGRIVYVGGDFDTIGSQPRVSVAALDAVTGRATDWDANVLPHRFYIAHGDWIWPEVDAIVARGNTVWIGGGFDHAGGQPRNALAALDARTGMATAFDGQLEGGVVNTLSLDDRTLCAGGSFYHVAGAIRPNVAAFDVKSGALRAWNPRADGPVASLSTGPNGVYVGGGFTSLHDWQPRNGLAALDLVTGAATDWDPGPDGFGTIGLAALGNAIYVVGYFSTIGGEPRGNLAAVDAITGKALPWNAGFIGSETFPIYPMLATGDGQLYVAGWYYTMGNAPRAAFAALDPVTGNATTWDTYADDGIGVAILPHGNTVYVAGDFRHIGGADRRHLAALDAASAAIRPFNPGPADLFITTLAANDSTLYVGGTFWEMGGAGRIDLAAVDATTGLARPWNPQPDGDYTYYNEIHIDALAVCGENVWAAGKFSSIDRAPRPYLAALDPLTGEASAFEPKPDGEVRALAVAGDTLYVGGAFRQMALRPRSGIAQIFGANTALRGTSVATTSATTSPGVLLARCEPNPARAFAAIRFTLPAAMTASVAVYDLEGRRVATPMPRSSMAAGRHDVALDTGGWAPGVYLYRLETTRGTVAHKLAIVR
jgi:hypothetical protein